ncbi:MAG: transcription antitermination factor NusB [Simkaniaceae bacterium]
MALPKTKLREAIFQILFCLEKGQDTDELIPFMMKELKATRANIHLAHVKAKKIMDSVSALDEIIKEASIEYASERITSVEKNILRLSLFEMNFEEEVPPIVAIAEGVRLTRKFGSPSGANFVNAILDSVYKKSSKFCAAN